MIVTINDNDINVEVPGADDAPVLIAHRGGGRIGSLAEPKLGPGAAPCP
jgi:proline iminopeptidase